MKLDELIEYLKYKDLINFKNVEISGISYNSKTTKKGDIFVCLVGEHTDGHEYAQRTDISRQTQRSSFQRALRVVWLIRVQFQILSSSLLVVSVQVWALCA